MISSPGMGATTSSSVAPHRWWILLEAAVRLRAPSMRDGLESSKVTAAIHAVDPLRHTGSGVHVEIINDGRGLPADTLGGAGLRGNGSHPGGWWATSRWWVLGSVSVKTAPRPMPSLAACRLPSCAWARARAMVSPMPLPPP